MILSEKKLDDVREVFCDPENINVDFLIHCGSDGLYVGKLYINKQLVTATEKQTKFKTSLLELIKCVSEWKENNYESI